MNVFPISPQSNGPIEQNSLPSINRSSGFSFGGRTFTKQIVNLLKGLFSSKVQNSGSKDTEFSLKSKNISYSRSVDRINQRLMENKQAENTIEKASKQRLFDRAIAENIRIKKQEPA